MRRLILGPAIVLAFAVPAESVADGKGSPAHSPGRSGLCINVAGCYAATRPYCHQTAAWQLFTVRQAVGYARTIYAGTRTAGRRQLRRLGQMERCQRNDAAQGYVRQVDHHLARENAARRYAAAHPWSYATASWYDDSSGRCASGPCVAYGVANLSLPFGTRVTFSYGGRTVSATVDDRGPYVGGRMWDLDQNVAGALGFGGVGTVGYHLG